MRQSDLNDLLKIAERSEREDLILIMMEATKDYMMARASNKSKQECDKEYTKVLMSTTLIEMKEAISQVGVEGINKRIRESEFTNHMFNTHKN